MTSPKCQDVPLNRLRPLRDRKVLNREQDAMLASIKTVGLVEPLVVRPAGNGYVILDGVLRYKVLRKLGVEVAPCITVDSRPVEKAKGGTMRNPAIAGLAGKNYIAYARCASPESAGPKLQQQIRAVRQFADSLDMHCVCEVRLAGISGWLPALRHDLRDLLTRKRRENDYEVLIMEDRARLTRSDFHQEIEAKFAKRGVRIVYVAETGDHMAGRQTEQ